jgi:hypothetical protein
VDWDKNEPAGMIRVIPSASTTPPEVPIISSANTCEGLLSGSSSVGLQEIRIVVISERDSNLIFMTIGFDKEIQVTSRLAKSKV